MLPEVVQVLVRPGFFNVLIRCRQVPVPLQCAHGHRDGVRVLLPASAPRGSRILYGMQCQCNLKQLTACVLIFSCLSGRADTANDSEMHCSKNFVHGPWRKII